MISTWGVKWGYHHLRKPPYILQIMVMNPMVESLKNPPKKQIQDDGMVVVSKKKTNGDSPHFPTFLKMNEYPLNQLMVGSKIKWPPTRRSKGPFDVFEVAQQLVAPKTNPWSLPLCLFPSKKSTLQISKKSLLRRHRIQKQPPIKKRRKKNINANHYLCKNRANTPAVPPRWPVAKLW